MVKEVCLIGLFRSGTNYTRTLLEYNYKVEVSYDKWGWKHGPMPTYTSSSQNSYSDEGVLLVVKHPLSTLDSIFSYAKKNGRNIRCDTSSFRNFLLNPIIYFHEGEELSPEYYFKNPLQMWSSIVWNHLSLVEKKNGVVVRYEDLLKDPATAIKNVGTVLKLEKNSVDFLVPENVTQNMNDKKKRQGKEDYITSKKFDKSEYFKNKEYLVNYDSELIEFAGSELNKDLLKKLGYDLDFNHSTLSSSNGKNIIYTMCSDSRLSSLATLLESNMSNVENLIKVIPFDDDIELTRQLCSIYGATLVEPSERWDSLGKAIYKDEEYRAGVKSWRYFRKFNVFNESNEKFIFLDANVVLLNNLGQVFDKLGPGELVFAARSQRGRNFKRWSKELINISNPEIKDGFNAGFWCSNSDLFNDLDFNKLASVPGVRLCLTLSPEQSFLSLLAGLSKCKVAMLTDKVPDCYAMIAANTLDQDKLVSKEGELMYKGLTALSIKWQGKYFARNSTMPQADFLRTIADLVLDRVIGNKKLSSVLADSFEKLIGK